MATTAEKISSAQAAFKEANDVLQNQDAMLKDAEALEKEARANYLVDPENSTMVRRKNLALKAVQAVKDRINDATADRAAANQAMEKLNKILQQEKLAARQERSEHIASFTELNDELVDAAQAAVVELLAYRALLSNTSIGNLDILRAVEFITVGNYAMRYREKLKPAVEAMEKRLNLDEVA